MSSSLDESTLPSKRYREAVQSMLIWMLIFCTRPHKVGPASLINPFLSSSSPLLLSSPFLSHSHPSSSLFFHLPHPSLLSPFIAPLASSRKRGSCFQSTRNSTWRHPSLSAFSQYETSINHTYQYPWQHHKPHPHRM